MRSQHLPMLEAIRFGETMRRVAAATDDAAEGGRACAKAARPSGAGVDPDEPGGSRRGVPQA